MSSDPTDALHPTLVGVAPLGQIRIRSLAAAGRSCRLLPLVYCLFGKELIFNGRAGIFYALQRMVAEATVSLMVLEAKLRDRARLRHQNAAGGSK
jgi:hypothetical protein